jgi:hypothetical protein
MEDIEFKFLKVANASRLLRVAIQRRGPLVLMVRGWRDFMVPADEGDSRSGLHGGGSRSAVTASRTPCTRLRPTR